MLWPFLAISANLLWAFNNIFDRYIMEKKMKSPYVYTVLGLMVASAAVLVASPWIGWSVLPLFILFLALFAGGAYFCGTYFYIRSMQAEEASRVGIMLNIIPLFNFVLAWFFLAEALSVWRFLALLVLLLGGILGSVHAGTSGQWHFSKAFWLMLLSALFYSIVDVILRYASQNYPSGSLLLYMNVGLLLASSLQFFGPSFLKSFRSDIKSLNWKLWIGLISTGIGSRVGLWLSIVVLSVAPVSLATAFGGFQALFVFFVALLITQYAPRIMKEELDKKNLFLKLAALVLMLGGIGLLYL